MPSHLSGGGMRGTGNQLTLLFVMRHRVPGETEAVGHPPVYVDKLR